ncbi:hypothetical protein ISS06_00960 [Patescibacteria group bacterium]|nr:hypothetical protein [Patescibacteria group bacterium]
MTDKISTEKICFSNPKESNVYSKIYAVKPGEKFLKEFGQLMIIFDFGFKKEVNDKIVDNLKNWIGNFTIFAQDSFYKKEKIKKETEENFENFLQKINNWMIEEKSEYGKFFDEYIDDINIKIALLTEKNIYFSQVGEIQAHIIQDQAIQKISASKNKSNKFSDIVSGEIDKDSVLIFNTKNLFDYFSKEKIIQIIETTPVKKIGNAIKKLLANNDSYKNNLACLILSNQKKITALPQSKVSKKTTIMQVESETKDKYFKKEKDNQPTKMKLEIKKGKPKSSIIHKILFLILIILAILFISSVVKLTKQEIDQNKNKEYQTASDNFYKKIKALDMAIAFKDKNKTIKIFSEIKEILNIFPKQTNEQIQTYKLLNSEYFKKRNKFYKIKTITEPNLLFDLSEIDTNIQADGWTNIGDDFYIFNSLNNYIYTFNISSNESEILNNSSSNIGRIKKILSFDSDNLIGITQTNDLINFNIIDKEITSLKLKSNKKLMEFNDICIYNDRLYALNSSNNQIYKYSKTIDGFDKEEKWIKDESSVSNGLNISIDGNIYVLLKNGEIIKFFRNKEAQFNQTRIEPLISSIDPGIMNKNGDKIKLYSDADIDNIYLLDGKTKRLIIFDKQGKSKQQLYFPQFNNLKDFIISKNEQKAWLLNANKIFEINLE